MSEAEATNQVAVTAETQRRELTPLSEIDISQVEGVVRGAGVGVKEFWEKRSETKTGLKTKRQAITEADPKAQRELKDGLLAIHDASFFGEEDDPDDPRVTHEAVLEGDQWVVDPIDGTENIHGFPPVIGMSAGLMRDGVPVLGVIYDPIHDIMFSAKEGDDGIRVNGVLMKVSDTEDPEQAIVGMDFSSKMDTRPETLAVLGRVMEMARSVKVVGAPVLSLAAVASGDLDVFYRPSTKLPDVIAGTCLVRAAGGKVVNAEGTDWKVGDKAIIAGSPKMVEAYMPSFNPPKDAHQQLAAIAA